MAKKKAKTSVNKSAAVRDYAAANKGAKPKAIAEVLNKKGVKVSAAYVSTILSTAKRKKGKATVRRRKSAATNGAVTVDSIVAAAKFIKSSGGIENAKTALKAAEAVANAAG